MQNRALTFIPALTLILFLTLLFAVSTPAHAATKAAAFDFFDFRVQATGKRGDPAQSRFKSGQRFYIAWYVRIVTPPARGDHLTYTFSITPSGEKEGERFRSTAKVPAGYRDGVFRCGDASMKLTGKRAEVLTIKAQVMMNGVTRTRIRTITIMP